MHKERGRENTQYLMKKKKKSNFHLYRLPLSNKTNKETTLG